MLSSVRTSLSPTLQVNIYYRRDEKTGFTVGRLMTVEEVRSIMDFFCVEGIRYTIEDSKLVFECTGSIASRIPVFNMRSDARKIIILVVEATGTIESELGMKEILELI